MPTPLRAGLVGCGSLSQRGVLPHLSLPDAQETVKLVAVADVVEERAHAPRPNDSVSMPISQVSRRCWRRSSLTWCL